MGWIHPNILRGSQTGRPEVKKSRRHQVLNILDFAISDFPVEQSEDCSRHDFRVGCAVAVDSQRFRDYGKKVISRPQRKRFAREIPAIEIKSADEHWQLLTETNRIVHGQVITESVQNRPEGQVCFPVIGPIQLLHQLFQPRICTLNRRVEHVETRQFHARNRARDVPLIRGQTSKSPNYRKPKVL
jgi:hypothetical protein